MRNALRTGQSPTGGTIGEPHHFGLAYGAWAPLDTRAASGRVSDAERQGWLERLCLQPIDPYYREAYERWESSFSAPLDRKVRVTAPGRLLVGHGNASATEVGLTVNHTWGVPIIPGSSIKGLTAHYTEATYGPNGTGAADREAYRGVGWNEENNRILTGPGDAFRGLFGAPDADDKSTAQRGLVTFHDALYVPAANPLEDKPFVLDVLTVHQSEYYRAAGRDGGPMPVDWDDPNPVQFITIGPNSTFLLAVSGPEVWAELALSLATAALAEWGVGGKTAAGYGRLLPAVMPTNT